MPNFLNYLLSIGLDRAKFRALPRDQKRAIHVQFRTIRKQYLSDHPEVMANLRARQLQNRFKRQNIFDNPLRSNIGQQSRKQFYPSMANDAFFNVNGTLGSSSGMGSYDDNEETDYSGMGAGTDQSQIQTLPWYEQIGKVATSILPAYAAYDLERRKAKINIARAKQGLDPIDTGATATVGLSNDTKKLVYFGIGAMALVIVLPKLMSK